MAIAQILIFLLSFIHSKAQGIDPFKKNSYHDPRPEVLLQYGFPNPGADQAVTQ